MNQIYLKILYHGPTESGKTTNLQWIAKKKQADSLVFEKDFPFDLLTLPMEDFHTYQVRLQLQALSQKFVEKDSHLFILNGVNGIIFTIDSHHEKLNANLKSYESLEKDLEEQGYNLHQIPHVFQYNKRDLENPVPIQELQAIFNPTRRPYFECIAHQGIGVLETLQSTYELVIQSFIGKKE